MNAHIQSNNEIVTLSSPAKVNLRLKVVGRRGDGYHLLSMINSLISLSDQITLDFSSNSDKITLDWQAPGSEPDHNFFCNPDKNLASRAIELFSKRFDLKINAQIHICKRIPLGAGLGGGSGNAAVVLAHLLKRYQGKLPDNAERDVLDLACSLGADVPYMLHGGLALVGGIGEQIQPLTITDRQKIELILIFPKLSISTAQIFEELRAIPESSFAVDRELTTTSDKISYDQLCSLIANDLAPIASKIAPKLKLILDRLKQEGGIHASMSGSGSTLFVLPSSKTSIEQTQGSIQKLLTGLDLECRAVSLL